MFPLTAHSGSNCERERSLRDGAEELLVLRALEGEVQGGREQHRGEAVAVDLATRNPDATHWRPEEKCVKVSYTAYIVAKSVLHARYSF